MKEFSNGHKASCFSEIIFEDKKRLIELDGIGFSVHADFDDRVRCGIRGDEQNHTKEVSRII